MLGSPNPSSDLEARIVALERENRRLRWAWPLLFALMLGACVKEGPVAPDAITAREFRVVDEEGHVYATLGVAPWNPEGLLTLHDRNDDTRRASLDPADLVLNDGGASVHLQAGDISLLTMHDRQGWTGAKLSTHRDTRESSLWLTGGAKSVFRTP